MITIQTAQAIVSTSEELARAKHRLYRVQRRREREDAGTMELRFLAPDGSWQIEKLTLTPVVLGYVLKSIEGEVADLERKLRGMGAEVRP